MSGWEVQGMGREKVRPDWPALSYQEVAGVLAQYPQLGALDDLRWRSPRPMSAGVLVSTQRGGVVFVKRHHQVVRDASSLREEHAFGAHLRQAGIAVPCVLAAGSGDTTVTVEEWTYEVHDQAPGVDAYRDVLSWEPFGSPEHAAHAGSALARFHGASATFAAPSRDPGILRPSDELVRATDALAALEKMVERRPGLGRAIERWPWRHQLGPVIAALDDAAWRVAALRPCWGHGDWHPSNLCWSDCGSHADVVGVMDLGLANRTSAVHDLAVALERTVVGWLDLEISGMAPVDLLAAEVLVSAYVAQHPLSDGEVSALVALLPVVHVDLAVSEIEYFATVVCSPSSTELAFRGYLVGHAAWFERSPAAHELLTTVRRAATG